MNKDLTNGKPQTVLWQFCLPLFGSIIFQQLYNIADSLVAGKFIGENALAAVGNSYEITLIFIAFAFGCNIGCSVIVSMFFGAKRFREMKTAVSTSMITSGVICAVLMLIGGLFCGRLLQMTYTYGGCPLFSFITFPTEYSPPLEIPARLSCFWLHHPAAISLWISGLWQAFTWA